MVQLRKLFFRHTLKLSDPAFLPFLISFDTKSHYIIFQRIRLFACKSCKLRPQKTKYTLICEVLFDHMKETPDILYKGIQKNTSFMIHKYRNMIHLKCLLQIVSVYVHVTDDHTHIPEPTAFFSYKCPYITCQSNRFFLRTSRNMKPDSFRLFSIPGDMITENVAFQICKRILITETIRSPVIQTHRLLTQYSCFFCNLCQCMHHMLTECKQLIWMTIHIRIFPFIHGNRNDDLPAMQHQLF